MDHDDERTAPKTRIVNLDSIGVGIAMLDASVDTGGLGSQSE
jgi:hypothetical protein